MVFTNKLHSSTEKYCTIVTHTHTHTHTIVYFLGRNVIWIIIVEHLLFVVYVLTCVQTQGDVTLCLCLGLRNYLDVHASVCLSVDQRMSMCVCVSIVWTQRSNLKVLSYDIRYCLGRCTAYIFLRNLYLAWIWLNIESVLLLTTCLWN